ncbi:MAG: caspase family protein [Alphaproteobacteria bacterium]|nr:caspase family protein [Alphaproteobacteria bacterium]
MRARRFAIVGGLAAVLAGNGEAARAQSSSAAAPPQATVEWIGSIKCQRATAPLETIPDSEAQVRGLQASGKIHIEEIGSSGWRRFAIDIDGTGKASSTGSGSWEGRAFNSFFGGQLGESETTLQGSRHFSGPSAGIGNATFSQRCILTLARSGSAGKVVGRPSGSATREPAAKRTEVEPAQVAATTSSDTSFNGDIEFSIECESNREFNISRAKIRTTYSNREFRHTVYFSDGQEKIAGTVSAESNIRISGIGIHEPVTIAGGPQSISREYRIDYPPITPNTRTSSAHRISTGATSSSRVPRRCSLTVVNLNGLPLNPQQATPSTQIAAAGKINQASAPDAATEGQITAQLTAEAARVERLAAEKAAMERQIAALRAEKVAAEKAATERASAEQAAAAKAASERAAAQRAAEEKAAADRIAAEKSAAEQQRVAALQAEKERAERERLAREQAARDQAAREQAERERLRQEQERARLAAAAATPRVAIPAAEKRIALVIGNGQYDEGRLPNPQGDARLMDNALKAVGFDVTLQVDADYQAMRRAIQAFGAKLAAAGSEAVGLFFYAGHGIQAGGRNYLIPIKAKLAREADLEIEAVNAGVLLTQMEHAQSRLNLVILDACRNNPFTRGFRSAGRGLARMDAPRGTLIAYSTAPDNVAADGAGANSPYAAALADAIRQPGVPVERTFKDVRAKVLKSTGNQQVPWEASSLVGEFAFLPVVSGAPAPVTPAPAAGGADIEVVFWQSIQGSTDRSDFEEYLRQFPNGRFAGIARNRVRSLK